MRMAFVARGFIPAGLRSSPRLIVPTLRVGMQPGTLCVPKRTQSVH